MRHVRIRALLVSALVAGACHGDGPIGPHSGAMSLTLTGPGAGNRAIMFDLAGPVQALSVPLMSGLTLIDTLGTDSARIAVIAPRGTSVGSGEIARVNVANVCAVAKYRVRLVEIAGSDYALQPLSGYALSVIPDDRGC